jgi:hypothetical protein
MVNDRKLVTSARKTGVFFGLLKERDKRMWCRLGIAVFIMWHYCAAGNLDCSHLDFGLCSRHPPPGTSY